MNTAFKKYVKHIVLLSVLVFGLGTVLFRTVFEGFYFSFFPFLVGIFLGVSVIVQWILFYTIDNQPKKFYNRFLLMMGLKLLVYIGVLFLYLSLSKENQIFSFVSTFILCYFIYTIYSVRSFFLYLTIQEKNKKRRM